MRIFISRIWGLLLFSLIGCVNNFDINRSSDTLFSRIPSGYSRLNFENNVEQTRANNHLLNVEFVSGGGVAVGDVNNDDLPDVFFTANQASDRLYLNKGNFRFEDISEKAGIGADDKWSTAVTFVDIDNDGDQDIYVCRFVYLENELSANQLYINNGDLTFTEQAHAFGVADKGFSTHATFCDFDKDHLIDLYVVNQPPSIPGRRGKISKADLPGIQFSDRLYKNSGNGKFIDITDKSNIRNFGFGLSALVGDFNNDSWQDIYVSNDFDVPDHLYINNTDGTFVDKIKQATKHITNFSMGSDAADYDNDGLLDVMVVDMVHEDRQMAKSHMTNIDTKEFLNNIMRGVHHQYMINTLQRNNGNGTFSELARLAGVDRTGWSWGPLFADFDNDGWKDIFITNGVIRNNLHSDLADIYEQKLDSLRQVARMNNRDPKELIDVFDFVNLAAMDKMPNYMYKNNGDYTFTNKNIDWGMELPTTSNGAAYADFDRDGDLDVIVNNLNGVASLYKNNASQNGMGNYIRFKLNPLEGQRIYGTKITLYRENKLWQVYHFTNTRGFRSKSESIAHFGVGTEKHVRKVVVEWQNNTESILQDLEANEIYTVDQNGATPSPGKNGIVEVRPLFKDATASLGLDDVTHRENRYDDFSKEVLLPYRMSYTGPVMAVGDINGDDRHDFFLGGAAGIPGKLFIQNKSGKFDEVGRGAWVQDKASEDTDVEFIDVDNDGDRDMIIASGGNEFDESAIELEDRLYTNNGNGIFTKAVKGLPKKRISSSCVVPNDFDNDGDLDLFIGGRLIPGRYPHPASSLLLENRQGRYVDVTNEKASGMHGLGLVTAANWTDHNGDGLTDLVVVGEWMPITLFTQTDNGVFRKAVPEGLKDSEGWYFTIKADDIDGDGDEDFIVGNLGLNYSYSATVENPFQVFSYDFDLNGSNDIIFGYTENGVAYPLTGRARAVKQIPSLKKTFDTYEKFSKSSIREIYGASMDQALNLQVKTFASSYVENLGDRKFSVKPLPPLAQASSINSVLVKDFNDDGNKDLIVVGNIYQTEIELPRHDAGNGLFLQGDGTGSFNVVTINASGFYAPHDAKEMQLIHINGKDYILVGNNHHPLQVFECLTEGSAL
ncbi:MAG: VCBS repeat-containing protein [Cytophagales bacterium]|nr:VCBS repeat-containing protein [Cytophagales bacterium]